MEGDASHEREHCGQRRISRARKNHSVCWWWERQKENLDEGRYGEETTAMEGLY